jgi:hypothetical protein
LNELPRRKWRGIRAIFTVVTPAQAGVQKALQDRIPAFAGMTAKTGKTSFSESLGWNKAYNQVMQSPGHMLITCSISSSG